MDSTKAQGIVNAKQHLEATAAIIHKAIETLQNNEEKMGYRYIDEICQGLEAILDPLYSTSEIHHINVTEINTIIKEIFEAMQNNDYVLLAELMEFELLEKIDEWKDRLSEYEF